MTEDEPVKVGCICTAYSQNWGLDYCHNCGRLLTQEQMGRDRYQDMRKNEKASKDEVSEPLWSLTYRSLSTLQVLINDLWCTKQCQTWLRIEAEHQDRQVVINAIQERMEELKEQGVSDCHRFCPHSE